MAFIPALTVSISMPVEITGEYAETRFASGGCGSGGAGSLRPPACFVGGADAEAAGVVDLAFAAGCLPFDDVVEDFAGAVSV